MLKSLVGLALAWPLAAFADWSEWVEVTAPRPDLTKTYVHAIHPAYQTSTLARLKAEGHLSADWGPNRAVYWRKHAAYETPGPADGVAAYCPIKQRVVAAWGADGAAYADGGWNTISIWHPNSMKFFSSTLDGLTDGVWVMPLSAVLPDSILAETHSDPSRYSTPSLVVVQDDAREVWQGYYGFRRFRSTKGD